MPNLLLWSDHASVSVPERARGLVIDEGGIDVVLESFKNNKNKVCQLCKLHIRCVYFVLIFPPCHLADRLYKNARYDAC